jgi:hypothetical protein
LVAEIMAELQTKEQFAEIMTAIRAQTEKLDGFNNKLETLEVKVASIEEVKPVLVDLALWKPRVDLTVGALQTDLGELRQSIDRLVINSAPPAPTAPAAAAPPHFRLGSAAPIYASVTMNVTGLLAAASTSSLGDRLWGRIPNRPRPRVRSRVTLLSLHLVSGLGIVIGRGLGKLREWIAPDSMGKGHWSGKSNVSPISVCVG